MRAIFTTMIALIGLSIAGRSRAQAPDTWSFGAGLSENRQFDRTVNGEPREDRTVDNANVTFGFSTSRERSRVSFFGRAGTNIQQEGDSRNRIDYGAGFAWDRRVTEYFESTLSLNVSKNFSRQTLSDLGIIAPDLTGFSTNARWGTQYQAGARTDLLTSVNYSYQEIGNATPIPGAQIVLDEQPFGDDLSIPSRGRGDGDLLVPEAEDDILAILATEGLAGTENRSHFASATFGLNHSISQRTTFGFDVGAGYRTFESGIKSEGSMGAGRFYVERRVGTTTSLNAAYEVRRSLVLEPTTTVQSLFGGVSTSGRERSLSFQLFGGVSHYDGEGVASQLTPAANVSLSGELTSTTTGSVTYRRQFSNTLGFGRTLLIDFASASLTQEFGSRVSLRLHAGVTYSTDPLDQDYQADALRAGGAVTVQIVGGLSAGTSLSAIQTELSRSSLTTKTRDNLWTIFLTFGTIWH